MPGPKLVSKGVFCLEGDWRNNLKRPSSIEPLLSIIDQHFTRKQPHIHKGIGTLAELEFYLSKWTQKRYRDYPILYLGFHGNEGVIHVGDQRLHGCDVSLDWLAERLAGKCEKQIIHFGSCSTLRLNKRYISRFLQATGALAVCGYETDVDWISSAAFELLVLTELQHGALTVSGAESIRKRILAAAKGLARDLKFRMEIRDAAWAKPKARAAGA